MWVVQRRTKGYNVGGVTVRTQENNSGRGGTGQPSKVVRGLGEELQGGYPVPGPHRCEIRPTMNIAWWLYLP